MKNDLYASLVILAVSFSAAASAAQMVSPSIDKPGEPFSYFSKPTDEIGIMDSEAATEVTPEGFLRTGFGELMFFTGPEYRPTSARVRTLEDGHLPIMSWQDEGPYKTWPLVLFLVIRSVTQRSATASFFRAPGIFYQPLYLSLRSKCQIYKRFQNGTPIAIRL